MRCIASFTVSSLVALTLVACTDPAPYMAISDAPGAISVPRDAEAAWTTSGGASEFHEPGTLQLPAKVTVRIEGRRNDADHDVNDPLRSAAIEIVEGSACRLSAPLTCLGGICFAELELTQSGLCLVRATGTTRDDVDVDTCWYRGTWESDPADPTFAARMDEMTNHAYDACLDRVD